jgi:glutamate decarboxylase
MVHLATIPPKESDKPLVEGMSKISLDPLPDPDMYTTSVYGSKYAAEDLPRHEMPDYEMPKEVAYKMIKDDLSLDGNPMLK